MSSLREAEHTYRICSGRMLGSRPLGVRALWLFEMMPTVM
jgi:hypothetical protein